MSQLTNPLEVLKSLSEATSLLIKKISQSVVSIKAQMSRGTGVVLTKDGYIVTCNHVLARMRHCQNWARRKNLQRKNRRHRPIQRRSLAQSRARANLHPSKWEIPKNLT